MPGRKGWNSGSIPAGAKGAMVVFISTDTSPRRPSMKLALVCYRLCSKIF